MKRIRKMKIKLLKETAMIPTRGTDLSAGYDIYAPYDVEIQPHKMAIIETGIALGIGEGGYGMIVPRSSIGTKRHLMLANTVGIIDADYTGEIIVAMYNYSDDVQHIKMHERFCQLILMQHGISVMPGDNEDELVEGIEIVDELDETDRGSGGFGSTGE